MTSASSTPASPELDQADSDGTDWEAVRHAYVAQRIPVRDICRDHGIFSQALYRRAGKEGWPRRREPREDAEARKTLKLLARLRRLAKGQIDQIEARSAGKTDSPGEAERDARTLTALAKLIEHIAAIEAKHQVGRHGAQDGTDGQSQAHRARRRAQLADQLIAMLEQERGAALPEGDGG
jgi:transposase-like protein